MSAQSEISILVTLKDMATSAMQRMTGSFEDAKKASDIVAAGLLGVGAAMVGFGILAVKAASDAQVKMASFNTTMDDLKGKAIEVSTGLTKTTSSLKVTGNEALAMKNSIAQAKDSISAKNMALAELKTKLDAGKISTEKYALAEEATKNQIEGLKIKISEYGDKLAETDTTEEKIIRTTKLTADAVDQAKEKIKQASDATLKLGFDNEEAANVMARFYQRTGSVTKAIELNGIAMDLARLKNISLSDAGNLVNMTLSGNAKMLKQYGIDIKEAATPLEALGQLHNIVRGQAQSFADTYNGRMMVLKTQLDELKETLGQKILPLLSMFIEKYLIPMVERFNDWATKIGSVNDIMKQLTQYMQQHATMIFLVSGAIIGALVPAMIALITSAFTLAIALAPFIIGGLIIAGIAAGIYFLVTHWDKVRELFSNIWNSIMKWIKSVQQSWTDGLVAIGAVTNKIFDAIQDKIGSVVKWIEDKIDALKRAYQSVVDFGASIGSGISGAASSAFNYVTGKRAAGGPVGGGMSYLVGERGPEIFTPGTSGFITPNGGGAQVNVYVTGNNINSDLDVRRLADTVGEAIMDKLRLNSRLSI